MCQVTSNSRGSFFEFLLSWAVFLLVFYRFDSKLVAIKAQSLVGSTPLIAKAHFTLEVKAKIELKSSILICGILKSAQGFYTRSQGRKKKILKKIYHFMTLTWPQGRERIPITLGGQFVTLEARVAAIKY
jgi:hypothetical protein